MHHAMPLSRQICNEPRDFSAALYSVQFVVFSRLFGFGSFARHLVSQFGLGYLRSDAHLF